MELGLGGKVAIVTGASRGIGLATVRALRAEGVTVVGAARRVTRELSEAGSLAVAGDLTTPDGVDDLGGKALNAFGRVDLLVNNVGGGDTPTVAGFLEIANRR